ncbi:AAA family ATPase [Aurantibacter sp.]|uniref:AAA family ATPase n=1 Tax=Aurantibacter sp. TaxID=2807103 RepID=UPI0032678B73
MNNIQISNFRKIKDTWNLDLAPVTFFTGTNNSGKSTIFKAILILEDHIISNNHFELNFNGENARKHKIDCYSNALNRVNCNNKNKDLIFQYSNKDFEIKFHFQPNQDKTNGNGRLLKLELKREDDAKLLVYHKGGSNYQLEFDDLLLNRHIDTQENIKPTDDETLVVKIENLINDNRKELIRLNDKAVLFEKKIAIIKKRLASNTKILGSNEKDISKNLEFIELSKQLKTNKQKIISLNQEIVASKRKQKIAIKNIEAKNSNEKSIITYRPEFSLEDFHPSERTLERIIRRVLPKYLRENDKSIKLAGNTGGNPEAFRLGERISSALLFAVDHLSPQRNSQTRLYLNSNTSTDINELIKIHSNRPIVKQSKAGKFLKEWMIKFDVGTDYQMKSIDGVATKIEIFENDSWVNLVDKGFGAGQIFSILLKVALSIDDTRHNTKFKYIRNRRKLIVIEEPEANLHPALQSKLADLFAAAFNEFGIRFIIETHSEYVIRQSQFLNLENPDLFGLYYFDKNDGPYAMNYMENGKFDRPFGSGFFNVADDLAVDMYKANLKNK